MFDMAWISEPSAWVGLLTLIVLEIVLGIDNLLFIAILASKLPAKLQDKARYLGLGLALLTRLCLIVGISWVVTLVEPVVTIRGVGFSVRDIILMAGGLFLLFKSTSELHAKLEGEDGPGPNPSDRAVAKAFWAVVLQIVVLDAIFSLDSVITAVGMCEHVFIMMFAVIIAMGVMVSLSKFLTVFVSGHPTLVILCLSFLLMIGFSLLADGLHIHVPKGYLYTAIAFSILIEIFNQIARKNNLRLDKNIRSNSREFAAGLVLRILGARTDNQIQNIKESIVAPPVDNVFAREEKDLVARVLGLDLQPVRAIMTSRKDVAMVDIGEPYREALAAIAGNSFSHIVAYANDNRDNPLGIISKSELLERIVSGAGEAVLAKLVRKPLYIPETVSVLTCIDEMKRSKTYTSFVVDEFGNFEGIVALRDIMEEIAGDLPEKTEAADCQRNPDGSWTVRGDVSLAELERRTGVVVPAGQHYHTVAGYVVETLQNLPREGTTLEAGDWLIRVAAVREHSVETVTISRTAEADKDKKDRKDK